MGDTGRARRRGDLVGVQLGLNGLPSAVERIRQAACRDKRLQFTTLWHHVYNLDRLREAYRGLKREAAPGVDGETWRHYGEDLEGNLRELSKRLKRGAYRAKPVRRAYIPKPDGRKRPLGITVLEDKIVQTTFSWIGTSHLRDVTKEIADLKKRFSGEVQVHGSCGLAQTLIKSNLVDEYRLLIFPVILGIWRDRAHCQTAVFEDANIRNT